MLSKYFYQRSSEHVKNFPVCGNRVWYNQSTDWQMDVVLGVQHRITGLRSGVLLFLHLRATPKPLRQHPMKETECQQLPYSHIICGVSATLTLSCRLPADIPQHTQPSSKAVLFGRTSVSQRDYNQINNAGGRADTSPTAWEWKREIHTLAGWHPQSEPHPSASQPQNKGRCYTLDVVIGRNASEWVSV